MWRRPESLNGFFQVNFESLWQSGLCDPERPTRKVHFAKPRNVYKRVQVYLSGEASLTIWSSSIKIILF